VRESWLAANLNFLLERGIRGFVLMGSGEYCLTSAGELSRILSVAAGTLEGHAVFACGIGAPGIRGCLEKARLAASAGARALLLPMPHFFPYEQDDLYAFAARWRKSVPHRFCSIICHGLPPPWISRP